MRKTAYKYRTIAAMVMVCLSGTSCSDFLKENPSTMLDRTAAYSSESAVRSSLKGCYACYANNEYRGELYELNSSVVLAGGLLSNSNTVAGSVLDEIKPDSPRLLPTFYAQAYKTLEHLNVFLESMPQSPVGGDFKKQSIAEARFLRAVIYFDLVRLIGRVPLRVTATTAQDRGESPRAPLRDIYAQIISDFSDAEQNMPTKEQQEDGFPHRTAATAYLAKVYVQMACLTDDHFEASNELGLLGAAAYAGSADRFRLSFIPEDKLVEFGSDTPRYFWAEAYEKTETVINSNHYSLVYPFGRLWRGRSRNTSESIFEIQYSAAFGTGTTISARTSPYARSIYNPLLLNNSTSARTSISFATFGRHWTKYGRKDTFENPIPIKNITSGNEINADPRFNETYIYYSYRGYTQVGDNYVEPLRDVTCFPNKSFQPRYKSNNFTYIKKHLDSLQTSTTQSHLNFIVYRYADLLLLRAECLNELDQKADAINLINTTILDRARRSGVFSLGVNPEPANWEGTLSKDEVRNAIMEEREYELLGEGHETFDVRRRGVQYLKARIEVHDEWSLMVRNDLETWTNAAQMDSYVYCRIYSQYDPYRLDPERFCKKHLFVPFPQKEINLNSMIPANDQNYGWND